MMTNRLVVAVLIFVAFCVACVPNPPSPQPQASGRESTAKCMTDDGPAFAGSVLVLDAPDPLTGKHRLSTKQLSTPQVTDLTNAYCNAPESFRRQLDNIDFVFVDAGKCNTPGDPATCPGLSGRNASNVSWGQRWTGGYTQIGIPAGLWNLGASAVPYPVFESDILAKLVGWTTTSLQFTPPANNPDVNSSWMTVLAALAHEAGHVRWYQANHRSGFKLPYDFRRLTNSCNFFIGWQAQTNDGGGLEPPPWRGFGDWATNNEHAGDPTISQFKAAGDDQTRNNLLSQLFANSQPWASFFSSMSPDEDFVETFKFWVLFNAGQNGLNTLPITIPVTQTAGGPVQNVTLDIPDAYSRSLKSNLKKKTRCIKRWM